MTVGTKSIQNFQTPLRHDQTSMPNPRLYDRIQPMHNPPQTPSANPHLSSTLPSWVTFLARHKLAAPALLFAAGHRPLAFVTGQMIHLVDPVLGLLGFSAWERRAGGWADLLSHPDGAEQILAALEAASSQPKDAPQ